MSKNLKVLNVSIKNFKLFEELEVPLNGNHVYLVGPNGSGKSTFIDAIYSALTGKDVAIKAIKEGEEKGKIEVEIGNDEGESYQVQLSFTKNNEKGYLKLKMNNGFQSTSPRKDLDSLIGNVAFDPFEFIELSTTAEGRRKQAQIVKQFLGITFDDLEEKKQSLYNERKEVNQSARLEQSTIESLQITEEELDQYKDKVDISEVSNQINKINEVNNKVDYLNQGIQERRDKIAEGDMAIKDKQEQIERLTKQIEDIKKDMDDKQKEIDKGEKWLKENKKQDTGELVEKMNTASEHNSKVHDAERLEKALKKKKEYEEKSEELTEQMNKIDEQKEKRIKKAKCPVEGLGFDEEGLVTIDGLPFDDNQIEKSRIIKVGVELLMAMQPNLKIIRIKDGSLLDPNRRKTIEELVQKNGYQAFFEFVATDASKEELEVTVIEDLTKQK